MFHLFQVLIYQPFLNLLVGIYWLLGFLPGDLADMGIAVVIFTIIIRILLLPVSLSAHRSEHERREIEDKIKAIEIEFATDPVRMRKKVKKVLRGNRRIIVAEIVSLFIQVVISLMLWRIFANGLPGDDLHLIYKWMPKVELPFNLVFLGRFDLSHPDMLLNLIQTGLIFVVETVGIYLSPYPVTRGEVVRLQLVLPFVAFIIFSQLPAGKKLFVISTLAFSLVLMLALAISKKFNEIREKLEKKDEEAVAGGEKVVVEVK